MTSRRILFILRPLAKAWQWVEENSVKDTHLAAPSSCSRVRLLANLIGADMLLRENRLAAASRKAIDASTLLDSQSFDAPPRSEHGTTWDVVGGKLWTTEEQGPVQTSLSIHSATASPARNVSLNVHHSAASEGVQGKQLKRIDHCRYPSNAIPYNTIIEFQYPSLHSP